MIVNTFDELDRMNNAEANNRLSDAAPDLLEALVALYNDYKALADSGDAGYWCLEETEVGRQALAAIDQASPNSNFCDRYKHPKKPHQRKIEIDISGSDGNAFVLLGYARQYANQLGIDSTSIIEDMMSSDYENMLEVFDNNFGDYIDLVR